jgi:hypothetical protein
MPVAKRQKAIWIAMLAAFGVASTGRRAVQPAHRLGPGSTAHGPDRRSRLSALIGVTLLACVPFWRRLDDMARQAHLSSWYWGASFGGGVALLSAVVLGGARSPLFQGAALVFFAQVAAYVVFWLAWWARRRPRVS